MRASGGDKDYRFRALSNTLMGTGHQKGEEVVHVHSLALAQPGELVLQAFGCGQGRTSMNRDDSGANAVTTKESILVVGHIFLSAADVTAQAS